MEVGFSLPGIWAAAGRQTIIQRGLSETTQLARWNRGHL